MYIKGIRITPRTPLDRFIMYMEGTQPLLGSMFLGCRTGLFPTALVPQSYDINTCTDSRIPLLGCSRGPDKVITLWGVQLGDTADMSAAWYSRHVCCVAQQTWLLCHTEDISALPHSSHVCCETRQTCLLCDTTDTSAV